MPTVQALHRPHRPVPVAAGTLCTLALCLAAPGPLTAQPALKTRYLVLAWAPLQAELSLQATPNAKPRPLKAGEPLEGATQVCAAASQGQTLVQVRPSEGGEARYLALGGTKPSCAAIGPGWTSAKPTESHWYKALFAWFQPEQVNVRVSASTGGQGRGGDSSAAAPSQPLDPCGLWPADAGQLRLAAGDTALVLGTSLPPGTTVFWTEASGSAAPSASTTVTDGRIHLPRQTYQVGERWQLAATTPANTKVQCAAQATVQAARTSPLAAMQESAPALQADPDTAHATLVAALLADSSQVAWYAWLLSTLPSGPDTPSAGVGAQLQRDWWRHASRVAAAPQQRP